MSSQSHAHILFPRRAFIEHDFADRVLNLIEHYLIAKMHTAGIDSKDWRIRLKHNIIYIETLTQHRLDCADLIDQLAGIRRLEERSDMDEFRCWHLHGVKIILAKSFVSEIAYRALAREWLA